MTKQFPVLPVEDYYVVVDKDAVLKVGDFRIEKDGEILKTHPSEKGYDPQGCVVIAAIGKRIEGLPLIELYDEAAPNNKMAEAIQQTFKQFYQEEELDTTIGEYEVSFLYPDSNKAYQMLRKSLEEYKAAQTKGQYSEEDMRKAWENGREEADPTIEAKINGVWKKNWKFEDFIPTLHPKRIPTSVTLEMMRNGAGELERYVTRITNTDTNTIIPKEVHYE